MSKSAVFQRHPLVCDCDAKIFESGQNKHRRRIAAITLTGLEESCRKNQPENTNCGTETSEGVHNLVWIIPLACLLIAAPVLIAVIAHFKSSKMHDDDEEEKNKIYDAFISYCHQVTILKVHLRTLHFVDFRTVTGWRLCSGGAWSRATSAVFMSGTSSQDKLFLTRL